MQFGPSQFCYSSGRGDHETSCFLSLDMIENLPLCCSIGGGGMQKCMGTLAKYAIPVPLPCTDLQEQGRFRNLRGIRLVSRCTNFVAVCVL